jgi:hypothetical protein
MRATIAQLRGSNANYPEFDELFMSPMREIIRHVADEETILLLEAEKSMSPQLRTLSATMNRRRLQLIAKRPTEIAVNQARAFALATLSLGAIGLWAIAALARSRGRG